MVVPLLTTEEVAERFRTSPSTVRYWPAHPPSGTDTTSGSARSSGPVRGDWMRPLVAGQGRRTAQRGGRWVHRPAVRPWHRVSRSRQA